MLPYSKSCAGFACFLQSLSLASVDGNFSHSTYLPLRFQFHYFANSKPAPLYVKASLTTLPGLRLPPSLNAHYWTPLQDIIQAHIWIKCSFPLLTAGYVDPKCKAWMSSARFCKLSESHKYSLLKCIIKAYGNKQFKVYPGVLNKHIFLGYI